MVEFRIFGFPFLLIFLFMVPLLLELRLVSFIHSTTRATGQVLVLCAVLLFFHSFLIIVFLFSLLSVCLSLTIYLSFLFLCVRFLIPCAMYVFQLFFFFFFLKRSPFFSSSHSFSVVYFLIVRVIWNHSFYYDRIDSPLKETFPLFFFFFFFC